MKKVLIGCSLILFLILCLLRGYSGNKGINEQIIGYWMKSNADTVSFTDENTCSINNSVYSYKIYDNNHLQVIANDNYTWEYIFKLENNKLYIKPANSNTYEEYTKDEAEQKKIIEKVQQAKTQAIAEQKKQEKILELNNEIEEYENLIADANWRISNNEKDITRWEQDSINRIKKCEESIAFGDDKEYQENLRDDFLNANNESIQSAKERIQKHKNNISAYEQKIEELKNEIAAIS